MADQSEYQDSMDASRPLSGRTDPARKRRQPWWDENGAEALRSRCHHHRAALATIPYLLTALALSQMALPAMAAPECSAKVSSFRASANGQYTEVVGSGTCDGAAQIAFFSADGRQALDVVTIHVLAGAFKTLSNRLPREVKYRITYTEPKLAPAPPKDEPPASAARPVQNKCTVERNTGSTVVTCIAVDPKNAKSPGQKGRPLPQ